MTTLQPNQKIKLRATFVYEYWAAPNDYIVGAGGPTPSIEEMIALDQQSLDEGALAVYDFSNPEDFVSAKIERAS